MSRLFISHSSQDNAEAEALRVWLAREGWADVFLDLDPRRGIAAGERWERALNQAALRCEAVLFLVTRAWLASDWCQKEFGLAHRLNKRLFGILVEDLAIADLPVNLTSAWQLVNLAGGRDHVMLAVTVPATHVEAHVTFSAEGLTRLRVGLQRAGLDPNVFAWPPQGDPERSPFPGLKPLEAEDAGIFFGREAQTVEALDRLRALKEAAGPRLFCVLGASGSGKSSFLRAGLWPRLERDDRAFLPLPVLRAERAAISGRTGLVAGLETALRRAGIPRARAAIRAAAAEGAAGLRPLLGALVDAAAARLGEEEPDGSGELEGAAPRPLLVVPIDQGEELFRGEGAREGAALLELLAELMREDAPALAVLVTIRSDAFEALQLAPALEGVAAQTMTFAPMARGVFSTIIEGPAARMREADRPLAIEPALTRALLADMEEGGGRDALPLLAFTLERLWLEFGASGELRLADYEALGRVRGSIETAVERALDDAGRDPRLPSDRAAKLLLLRRALVPWLAGIDPDTGSPRRRVARWSEIPDEARPMVELLVEQRLLASDTDPATGEATVEPAHEALLRQWGLLQGWLEEDFAALATLEGLRRATRDWLANDRGPAWLAHAGTRLEDAERLRARPDIAAQIGPAELAYLQTCRERDDRLAAGERRQVRQRRWLLWGSLAAALVFAAIGIVALLQARDARRAKDFADSQTQLAVANAARATENAARADVNAAQADANAARADANAARAEAQTAEAQASAARAQASENQARQSERGAVRQLRRSQTSESVSLAQRSLREGASGDAREATRLALAALPKGPGAPDRPVVAQARFALAKAVADDRLVARFGTADQINHAVFTPDGAGVLTSDRAGVLTEWDAATGAQRRRLPGGRLAAFVTAFAPDGTRVATTYQDPPSVIVRDARTWRTVQDIRLAGRVLTPRVVFTDGGRSVVTAGAVYDGTPQVWSVEDGRPIRSLPGSSFGFVSGLVQSRDGRFLARADSSGLQVWTMPGGEIFLADRRAAPNADDGEFDPATRFTPAKEDDESVAGVAFLEDSLLIRGPRMLYRVALDDRRVVRAWRYRSSPTRTSRTCSRRRPTASPSSSPRR